MSDFQWDKDDVEKFKRLFKGVTTEIKASNIHESSFRRAGRKRPKAEDFRQLMRLIVKDKSARVKQGLVSLKKYRIQMVSDDYPYLPKTFDDVVFNDPYMVKPLPAKDELIKRLPKGTEWDESLQYLWELLDCQAKLFKNALQKTYVHDGFDLDLLFESLIGSDGKSVTIDEFTKEKWALEISFYISMYDAFKIGKKEISNSFGIDHNKAFLTAYSCHFIRHFLSRYWSRSYPKKLVPNKYAREALTLRENGQSIPKNVVNAALGQNEIDDYFLQVIHKANGEDFLPALKESTDSTVVRYCDRCRTAYSELLRLHLRQADK